MLTNVGVFLGARPPLTVSLLATHLNIFVYSACFWLTNPILPYRSKDLGADPLYIGYIQTFIAIGQLLGSPLIGKLCDNFGPRWSLLISNVAAASLYACMGLATSVEQLFFSQVFNLMMHAMHSGQALATVSSDDDHRAIAIGRLSLSYGLGMITGGPLLSLLTPVLSHSSILIVASLLCVATLPLTLCITDSATQAAKDPSKSTSSLLHILSLSTIQQLTFFQLFLGLSLSLFRSSFVHLSSSTFNLQAGDMGLVHSFVGVLALFSNTFIVPLILKYLSERHILLVCTVTIALSMVSFSVVMSKPGLLLFMVPQTVASTVAYTVVTSVVTKLQPADAGVIIGLSHATRSFCHLVSPLSAAYLLQLHLVYPSPLLPSAATTIATACCSVATLALLTLLLRDHTRLKLKNK